jgi:hypothetical protein
VRSPVAGAAIATWVGLGLACSAPSPASTGEPRPGATSPSTSPAVAGSAGTVTGDAQASGFSRTLTMQGITFRVSCPNRGSLNELRIEPEGLLTDNSPMVQDVDGRVTEAEVADLNADGSPEVYVYVQSAGSGSYGSLVAFSANSLKSLSGIYLPPVAEQPRLSTGYMGHDEFAVSGDRLMQRFPLYRDIDANATPTGGIREVRYRLDAGEAGWVLRVDRVVEQ